RRSMGGPGGSEISYHFDDIRQIRPAQAGCRAFPGAHLPDEAGSSAPKSVLPALARRRRPRDPQSAIVPVEEGACMPQYLSPGVYVEEVDSGSRPIEGVGTAVAAFVGMAQMGPPDAPTLVTNWGQFTQTFGDFMEGSYLAHAVY